MTKGLFSLWLPMVFVANISFCQAQSVSQNPVDVPGAEARVYKKVGDIELRLYVFQPDLTSDRRLRPAIIFFFGGGWNSGSVDQFVPHSHHFAKLGFVSIVADYRVRSRHGVTPFECVADAKSALRWVREHAAEYLIDPDRIVAAGGSAGGHLAASTALLDAFDETGENMAISARPNALVLFNPALDMTELRKHMRADSSRAEQISPLHHLRKDMPPTIIFHGTADTTVPFTQATRFCQAMKDYGDRCEVVAFEGRAHAFFNVGKEGGVDYRTTLEKTEAFLASLGFLSQERTK